MLSDTAVTDLIINWSLVILEKSIYYSLFAQPVAPGQTAARHTDILNEKIPSKLVPAKAEIERSSTL